MEKDFIDFLQNLIDSGWIEGDIAGISKQVIDKGYSSLTNQQKYTLKKGITSYCIEKCKECTHNIPWGDMIDALENGGYCSECKDSNNYFEREIEKYN